MSITEAIQTPMLCKKTSYIPDSCWWIGIKPENQCAYAFMKTSRYGETTSETCHGFFVSLAIANMYSVSIEREINIKKEALLSEGGDRHITSITNTGFVKPFAVFIPFNKCDIAFTIADYKKPPKRLPPGDWDRVQFKLWVAMSSFGLGKDGYQKYLTNAIEKIRAMTEDEQVAYFSTLATPEDKNIRLSMFGFRILKGDRDRVKSLAKKLNISSQTLLNTLLFSELYQNASSR